MAGSIVRAVYPMVRAWALASSLAFGGGQAWAFDYGAPGSPVALTVGHPCCYAATWSAYVVRAKEFWKKYLPAGSTVTFEIALAGPPILNAMFAGKQQIGYLGDTPAIIATTKRDMADIRLVAALALAHDQCNILLVRPDAPAFAKAEEAVRWLDKKDFAVPRGTCGDRFAQDIFKRENVTPANYVNKSIELITTGFRAGNIDGAAVWEPVASQLVNQKLARRAASGATYGIMDAAFLTVRADLMQARPDVVQGWIEAELDAELFIADPKNAGEVVAIIKNFVPGFSPDDLKDAIYGRAPAEVGGTDVRMIQPFVFTPDVRALLKDASAFLYSVKAIPSPDFRDDAVESAFVDKAVAKRGLTAPIGKVVAQ
jgi:NitT/TauT family transport system substrate-binding protein